MPDRRGTASVTRLLGLHLTPGKLRGLQRISNPNGTLTMVATDQNSSMIGMMKEVFKKKGQEREPTYEEIVEAIVDGVALFCKSDHVILLTKPRLHPLHSRLLPRVI